MRRHTCARLVAVTCALANFKVPSAAADGPKDCVTFNPRGFCIEWEEDEPIRPVRGGDEGGVGDNTSPDEVVCFWKTIESINEPDGAFWDDYGLIPPPAGISVLWQLYACSDGSDLDLFRWVVAPTAENLSQVARGRVVGELPQPLLLSSPPLGVSSILGVPVFVEVMNWTGLVRESECAAGLCVAVTAVPSLSFDPGEPGSAPIACAGKGSRYEQGRGSPEVQAGTAGACAYAYRLRTGAEGRPREWPGAVSVTWTLSWAATSGVSGSLPSVTRSTVLPRAVSEVQTVLVGGVTP